MRPSRPECAVTRADAQRRAGERDTRARRMPRRRHPRSGSLRRSGRVLDDAGRADDGGQSSTGLNGRSMVASNAEVERRDHDRHHDDHTEDAGDHPTRGRRPGMAQKQQHHAIDSTGRREQRGRRARRERARAPAARRRSRERGDAWRPRRAARPPTDRRRRSPRASRARGARPTGSGVAPLRMRTDPRGRSAAAPRRRSGGCRRAPPDARRSTGKRPASTNRGARDSPTKNGAMTSCSSSTRSSIEELGVQPAAALDHEASHAPLGRGRRATSGIVTLLAEPDDGGDVAELAARCRDSRRRAGSRRASRRRPSVKNADVAGRSPLPVTVTFVGELGRPARAAAAAARRCAPAAEDRRGARSTRRP